MSVTNKTTTRIIIINNNNINNNRSSARSHSDMLVWTTGKSKKKVNCDMYFLANQTLIIVCVIVVCNKTAQHTIWCHTVPYSFIQ